MKNSKVLPVLGLIAGLMVLFPPVQTFQAPIVLEDRGIAWQLRGGRWEGHKLNKFGRTYLEQRSRQFQELYFWFRLVRNFVRGSWGSWNRR